MKRSFLSVLALLTVAAVLCMLALMGTSLEPAREAEPTATVPAPSSAPGGALRGSPAVPSACVPEVEDVP